MARRHLKAGALTAPLPPVLVTVGDMEKANVLTVAWTGILATIPPKTYISVRPSRHSHAMLSESGEFVINLPTTDMVRTVDYVGIFTGAKVDKIAATGLKLAESQHVKTPTLADCPIALECRVCDVWHMGTHDVFVADILGVSCDERIFDEDGKMHFERADLLAYAHGEYYALGEKLAEFGFSAKKTRKKAAPDKGAAPIKASAAPKEGKKPDGEVAEGRAEKKPFYLTAPKGKGKGRRGKR